MHDVCTEIEIKSIADAMVTNGMQDAGYSNFDIILVHLTRVCQPSTTPLAPCAMFYVVSILTGC